MTSRIYLAGPITGLSSRDARFGWRGDVIEALENTDIECLSPMRHKDHLRGVSELSAMGDPSSVMSCPRGLTTRDRMDVLRSDMLFVNFLGAEKISAGTMIEFGWADMARKPIVCCMEEDNTHLHAMVDELIGFNCRTLEEAIEITKAIIVPARRRSALAR